MWKIYETKDKDKRNMILARDKDIAFAFSGRIFGSENEKRFQRFLCRHYAVEEELLEGYFEWEPKVHSKVDHNTTLTN